MENQVIKTEKSKILPNVVRKNYERELYSMGSLEAMIKAQGGVILGLTANYKNWKVIVKFK